MHHLTTRARSIALDRWQDNVSRIAEIPYHCTFCSQSVVNF